MQINMCNPGENGRKVQGFSSNICNVGANVGATCKGRALPLS